jgi:hypothetical protein
MNAPIKTYTWEEILDIQKTQQHPHFSLYNLDGSRIVAFNKHGSPVEEKLEEIKTTLTNPLLSDGIYYVRAKNTLNRSGSKFDYPIIIGDPEIKEETPPLSESSEENFEPNVTSYSNVLDLKVENERLKLENKQLKKEIEELEEELDDLEDELKNGEFLNEDKPDIMSNIQTLLTDTLTVVSPMLDKHFELKERKLAIEEKRIGAPQQMAGAPDYSDNYQKDAIELTDRKIQEFIRGYNEQDPELTEKMVKCYNQAESMNDFFAEMQEILTPDQFQELVNYINNGE